MTAEALTTEAIAVLLLLSHHQQEMTMMIIIIIILLPQVKVHQFFSVPTFRATERRSLLSWAVGFSWWVYSGGPS